MFPTSHSRPVSCRRSRDRGTETWRQAARLVADRWQLFLEAGSQTRSWAFAAYVAALDAEEAAAAELAEVSSRVAA